jgi:hypothetical protein
MTITCTDGFTFSMVTGPDLYSGPGSVEIGYPSEPDELLEPHRQMLSENPTESVYPYTPLTVVAQLLKKHNHTPNNQ